MKVAVACHKWPPVSGYSSKTVDLLGLDTQTWYQLCLQLTFQTRLTYLIYVLISVEKSKMAGQP